MSDLESGTKAMDKLTKRRAAQKAWREKNPDYFKTYAADVRSGARTRKSRQATSVSAEAGSSILDASAQAQEAIPAGE